MNRLKFFQKVTVNGTPEVDFLWNNLSKFELKYEPFYYRIEEEDFMRPDLISYKIYGSVRYWWVILLVNKVQDPYSELTVGALIQLPSMQDIYEFNKRWRAR